MTSQVGRTQEGLARTWLYPSSNAWGKYLKFYTISAFTLLLKFGASCVVSAAFIAFSVQTLSEFVFDQRELVNDVAPRKWLTNLSRVWVICPSLGWECCCACCVQRFSLLIVPEGVDERVTVFVFLRAFCYISRQTLHAIDA